MRSSTLLTAAVAVAVSLATPTQNHQTQLALPTLHPVADPTARGMPLEIGGPEESVFNSSKASTDIEPGTSRAGVHPVRVDDDDETTTTSRRRRRRPTPGR
ncbi:hypothetical protein F4780DRAFT_780786 [Xylariomycetidae sp. FL0641]|nr:hypothetical protein F4780DRAFT_780786 [Xylariomycetidae sp. FL0641]